jgi:putative sigma-54 modulation protein
MKVIITGRRFNVSNSLKNAIEEKLKQRIRVLYNNDLNFHVFLEKEKLNYSADITFVTGKKRFYFQMKAPTIGEAIDKLIDKLERQVRKHKERAQKYSHERVADKAASPALALCYTQVADGTRAELDVLLRLADSEQCIEVFYPEDNPARAEVVYQESEEHFILYGCDHEDGTWYQKQIYLSDDQISHTQIEDYYPESMDDDHAAAKLEKEELTFSLYKNTESNKVQAILRDQGSYRIYVLEK